MNPRIYQFIGEQLRPTELGSLVKQLLLIRRKVFVLNGNYFYLDPVSNFGIRLMRDHHYEPETTDLISRTLKEGDVFVDLGGNEGYFAILASKIVGIRGKVICIEPQRRLWNVIFENTRLNHCLNIQLLPFAVSDKRDVLELILSPSNNTGSSGLVGNVRNSFWRRQSTEAIVLDDLPIQEKVKLIKIDIEGFELKALKGAISMLERKAIENILIEVHPSQLINLGQTEEELRIFLNGYGYFEHDGLYKPKG